MSLITALPLSIAWQGDHLKINEQLAPLPAFFNDQGHLLPFDHQQWDLKNWDQLGKHCAGSTLIIASATLFDLEHTLLEKCYQHDIQVELMTYSTAIKAIHGMVAHQMRFYGLFLGCDAGSSASFLKS